MTSLTQLTDVQIEELHIDRLTLLVLKHATTAASGTHTTS
jgi:hypothetical protein